MDRITSAPNVEVLYHSEVVKLDGEHSLRQITIRNKLEGSEKTVAANRLFICIGGVPNTEWAKPVGIMRDTAGYLVTGPDLLVKAVKPRKDLGSKSFSGKRTKREHSSTGIHEARVKAIGIVINAAAYAHTSVAVMDALEMCKIPIFEVHITNVFRREGFRHEDM
jgi:Dehydroquinase class II